MQFCRQNHHLAVFALAVLAAGCSSRQNSNSEPASLPDSNRIVAVSYALQYLTQRIAGETYMVEFPAQSSPSPRNWKPAIEDIASMQRAGLIVVNGPGVEYAQWLIQTTLPDSKICNSCEGLKSQQLIAVKDYQIVHSHGPEGEHSHAYMVPYSWLDPAIAIIQAETIAGCLSRTWPQDSELFATNLASLKADLQNLAEQLPGSQDEPPTVITENPHLKFLTRAAELEDIHLLWFDRTTAANWEQRRDEFEQRMGGLSATRFLVTETLDESIAEYFRNRGIPVVQLDPLDHRPNEGDYLSAMQQNIDQLK